MISGLIALFLVGFISFLTPTGPITILIFRNALLGKYGKSMMITFGAGVVQFFFCLISLIIVKEVISESITIYTQLISAVVFFVLGIYLLVSKHEKSDKIIRLRDLPGKEKLKAFLTGFIITGLNIGIVLSWLAIIVLFISFDLLEINGVVGMFTLSLSSFIGLVAGASLMMFLVHKNKRFFNDKFISRLMKILGAVILAISSYLFYSALVL